MARAGKCAEALDPLARAEQLFHAPTISVELGYCQCELGRLVEGTEVLNRVVRENLGASPPPAFVEAQERARRLLAEYQPKLAKLVIVVEAPEGADYEVLVDDKPVPAALIGAPRPTDPGERRVAAGGEGLRTVETSVTLEEGGSGEVTLSLERLPVPEPATASDEPVSMHDSGPSREPAALWPAYVGFGVGAVGLGVGSYFGWSALQTQGDLDDRCRDGRCPTGSQEDIDSMTTDANVATVGFALGAVGIGVGLYFLLTADGGSSEVASPRCPAPPCVRPLLVGDRLGLEGVF